MLRKDLAASLRRTSVRTDTELAAAGELPPWLGDEALHESHRSALVRKDPAYYRRFFPTEPDDLPYAWPAAAFPRWPVRRGRPDPLPLAGALGLLGLDASVLDGALVEQPLSELSSALALDDVACLLAQRRRVPVAGHDEQEGERRQ
jgi:hypothetical protein